MLMRLDSPVSAAPDVVIEPILHVVLISIGTLHQKHLPTCLGLILQVFMDIFQGLFGPVLFEPEGVHPPEEGFIRPKEEQFVEVFPEFAEIGAGSSTVVNQRAKVLHPGRLHMEHLRQAGGAPHLQLGQH